jgi:hypothetical protein
MLQCPSTANNVTNVAMSVFRTANKTVEEILEELAG